MDNYWFKLYCQVNWYMFVSGVSRMTVFCDYSYYLGLHKNKETSEYIAQLYARERLFE